MGLDARGIMDGLQVGRQVDVLLLCGVIAVAPPPLGHTTSTCDTRFNFSLCFGFGSFVLQLWPN